MTSRSGTLDATITPSVDRDIFAHPKVCPPPNVEAAGNRSATRRSGQGGLTCPVLVTVHFVRLGALEDEPAGVLDELGVDSA